MVLEKLKLWKLLARKEYPKQKPDVDKDINAIILFLSKKLNIKTLERLSARFSKMKELRKKEKILSGDALKKNILKQVKLYNKILKAYEIFQLDADVTGERVKKISTILGKKAKDTQIDIKWLEKIRKSDRWTFDW